MLTLQVPHTLYKHTDTWTQRPHTNILHKHTCVCATYFNTSHKTHAYETRVHACTHFATHIFFIHACTTYVHTFTLHALCHTNTYCIFITYEGTGNLAPLLHGKSTVGPTKALKSTTTEPPQQQQQHNESSPSMKRFQRPAAARGHRTQNKPQSPKE